MSPFLRVEWLKIKRLINEKTHKVNLATKGFITERQILHKSWILTNYLVEVAFTGLILFYTFTHYNWLSLGLASALIMYYVEWVVKLIKNKTGE